MKKTSLLPLMVVCLLLAVPHGIHLNRRDTPFLSFPAFNARTIYQSTPNVKQQSGIASLQGDKRWTAAHILLPFTSQRPCQLSFGENSFVLSLLAVMASLLAFAYQRYRKMKSDVKNEKEEALRVREAMEQEKQLALELAYRLINEEKEMAMRQAREMAVQQAREIIEQAREEARILQAKVTSASVQLANKNDYLLQLQERLQTTDNTDCKRFAREIKSNLGDTDHWADFIENFNLLHSHIIDKVNKKHHDLTINEIKLICFVLSGMSNKEIAGIFTVEPESIKKARYRLKKKLHLKEEESLKFYLDSLE